MTIPSFNSQIRQVMMLLLLLLLIFLVVKELYVFFPGLLGALTLYILSRGSYFQLVYHRKWKKGWAAGLYLLFYFLLLAGLVYDTFALVEKQVHPFLKDPAATLEKSTSKSTRSPGAIVSEVNCAGAFRYPPSLPI